MTKTFPSTKPTLEKAEKIYILLGDSDGQFYTGSTINQVLEDCSYDGNYETKQDVVKALFDEEIFLYVSTQQLMPIEKDENYDEKDFNIVTV